MKTSRIIAGLVVALAAPAAHGQIELDCRLNTERVLLFESIPATLRVANHTGRALQFTGPKANARLGFEIEQTPGIPLPPAAADLVEGELLLAPGESRSLTVDLLKAYRIRDTGPYSVRARVEWGDKIYLSGKAFLDVLPGLEVARIMAGVPGSSDTRSFALKTLTRNRSEQIFLQVDDDDRGACLGVVELGRVVRQFAPTMEQDAKGYVHILYQSSPWQFTHAEVNPDGIPVGLKSFSAHSAEVRLEKGADGAITVRGVAAPADSSLFIPPVTAPPAGKRKR